MYGYFDLTHHLTVWVLPDELSNRFSHTIELDTVSGEFSQSTSYPVVSSHTIMHLAYLLVYFFWYFDEITLINNSSFIYRNLYQLYLYWLGLRVRGDVRTSKIVRKDISKDISESKGTTSISLNIWGLNIPVILNILRLNIPKEA